MKIVTVGDNCMDVYLADGKGYPGGNPVNVAVYLRDLHVESAYIGWVGSDKYGDEMIRAIQNRGVNTTHISQKEGKTAITYVEMIGNDRSFKEYDEGVMVDFSLSTEELHFIQTHQLIHAGIWGHVEKYLPILKEKGLLTSFDFSDQLDSHLVKTLPPHVDFSFFSYTKDDQFIRDFLKEVKHQGSKVALATLGENGSLAYNGEHFYKCGVGKGAVVDTMGAGDSFISGFVYGILKGFSIQECLQLGTETAAKTIRYYGAW
ncbi:fructoselysine 6-kinase [Bacillus pakistanensis]|uniref:Fructoselysine 6-kinase n=1 Tax=Rossellomorea pakistanensis TaxID=992288 RepID=A0ABS2NB90_9BACI|nr:fructoselysine 6-kinase [Bacillus pakistanensis]MBM7585123.1 fructoselysine 6-kinase [Bacillus pakistanensis]